MFIHRYMWQAVANTRNRPRRRLLAEGGGLSGQFRVEANVSTSCTGGVVNAQARSIRAQRKQETEETKRLKWQMKTQSPPVPAPHSPITKTSALIDKW